MKLRPRIARSNPLDRLGKQSVLHRRRRTPLAEAILALAGASALIAALPGQAGAAVISYDYRTTLSYRFGNADTAGLIGATVDFKVDVDSNARYVSDSYGGGTPMVSLNDDATVTISGASVAANNQTYALAPLVFLPHVAGTFGVGGNNPYITLPGGILLSMNFREAPSAHGSTAQIGDLIDPLDFAPTTSAFQNWSTSSGTTYRQTDVIITASLPATSADSPPASAAVPEPASIALFGIGSVAALGAVRRRRTA